MERRQFPRIEMMLKVDCRVVGEQKRLTAKSVDVSLGGIGLLAKERVDYGKHIKMSISRPYFMGPIRAVGRVVWNNPPNNDGYHRLGIQFTEIEWTKIKHLVSI